MGLVRTDRVIGVAVANGVIAVIATHAGGREGQPRQQFRRLAIAVSGACWPKWE
jgi:hypothetical protein